MMRVIVVIDLPEDPEYVPNDDVADSVLARLFDEAGYLDNGAVLTPNRVTALVCTDTGKPLAYAESVRTPAVEDVPLPDDDDVAYVEKVDAAGRIEA